MGIGTFTAWAVHLLTACGAAAGLLALVAAGDGRLKIAFFWLALAAFIDAVDGPLARRFAVSRHVPTIDGALLDNLVDYLTYVVVPAAIFHRLLPPEVGIWTGAVICIVSAFQFSHVDAKTENRYFRGFPSYWNVLAIYAWLFAWSPGTTLTLVATCCVLVFVPIRFVYPSRTPRWRPLTLSLAAVWGALLVGVLAGTDGTELVPTLTDTARLVLLASLVFPAYYLALSVRLTLE